MEFFGRRSNTKKTISRFELLSRLHALHVCVRYEADGDVSMFRLYRMSPPCLTRERNVRFEVPFTPSRFEPKRVT